MGSSHSEGGLRIVVEGCGHGELEKIYQTIGEMEQAQGFKVDLLICCGDFQAVRNYDDLETMSVPPKYRQLATFYKYYSGELVAPVLTLFIGGNHEAANYLWELYHGGWVAPNIYFLGYAGVVNFGGLRIGGLSGIYNEHHYRQGHHESPPYNPKTIKSAYHVRELEVFRLLQLKQPLDIFLSHDWPRGVYNFGNKADLLRKKPFFRSEVERNDLGSPAAEQLMAALQPSFWFSAHLHVKHAALVSHPPGPGQEVGKVTKFLALDKCLPGRDFLQMIHIPQDLVSGEPPRLAYDPEWLAILRTTHSLFTTSYRGSALPHNSTGPSQEQIDFVRKILTQKGSGVPVPYPAANVENFCQTAPAIPPGSQICRGRMPTTAYQNPQTKYFLDMLLLEYNMGGEGQIAGARSGSAAGVTEANPEEIDIGDELDDEDAVFDGGDESAVATGNPEEIDLGEDEDEDVDDRGAADAVGGGGLFSAVEIHGSSVVDRRDV